MRMNLLMTISFRENMRKQLSQVWCQGNKFHFQSVEQRELVKTMGMRIRCKELSCAYRKEKPIKGTKLYYCNIFSIFLV